MRRFDLLILDADGTLRYTTTPGAQYPLRAEEQRLMPHVKETLSALDFSARGAKLAIASNQSGVARGELTRETAESLIEATLIEALGRLPERTLIALCTCPIDPPCGCRKPAPGLLLRALAWAGVPPERALYVGDLEIDREAAARARIRFMWARSFFRPPARRPG